MKALLLAALVTAACSDTHPDPTTEREQFATEVGGNYSFTFSRSCECLPETAGPFRIYVTGDSVDNATDLEGNAIDAEIIAQLPTIDDIFQRIEDAETEGAASIDVVYDPGDGYPTSVNIDYSEEIADEEYTVTVSNVEPTLAD
jgi:hypothetical protein